MRRWWLATLTAFALTPSTALGQSALSVQEALLRAKPAVAFVVAEVAAEVTLRCGAEGEIKATPTPYRETGTGWFVGPDGWLVTNAHVVSVAHQPPTWLTKEMAEQGVRTGCVPALLAKQGLKPGDRPDIEDQLARQTLVTALPTARVKLEPTVSVVLPNGLKRVAVVTKYSPPISGEAMSGRDLALLRIEAADMPTIRLGDSAAVKLGDKIHIIGFPGVVASHELLNQSAKFEASVTNGAISGFKQDRANQPVIQVDASAAPGVSGAPAVDQDGLVLGLLTLPAGDRGAAVQGFNFVIPSAAVREFLADTPAARPETSRFNTAWHAGLREFFAGRYSGATRHFTEANRLLPELPDVQRIAAENQERVKTLPLLPWGRVGAGMVVASVAGFGWLFYSGWRRNRFRISPSEVSRLLELSTEPPVMLDVRTAETYERSPVRIPRSVHVPPEDLATAKASLPADTKRMVVAYCS